MNHMVKLLLLAFFADIVGPLAFVATFLALAMVLVVVKTVVSSLKHVPRSGCPRCSRIPKGQSLWQAHLFAFKTALCGVGLGAKGCEFDDNWKLRPNWNRDCTEVCGAGIKWRLRGFEICASRLLWPT